MSEEIEFVHERTISRFVNDKLDLQVSSDGTDAVHGQFNKIIKKTLKDAAKKVQEEDGKRILDRHLNEAMEENLGLKAPGPEELLGDIENLSAADTRELTIKVGELVEELKKQ